MKTLTAIVLATAISGCAVSPNSFDRNNRAWSSAIVNCQSAAELAGTESDKLAWAHEKQELFRDRNGGWPSDRARLNNAIKKDKERLSTAGSTAISQRLTACRQVLNSYFSDGHGAT